MAGRPRLGNDVRYRALDLQADGMSLRKIAHLLSADLERHVGHTTVGNWVKDEGLRGSWQRHCALRDKRKSEPAPKPPVLKVVEIQGDLGLTLETARAYVTARQAGVSKRIAAHRAGLTEHDIDGWFEEAARGAEPFLSEVRRIRQEIAEAIENVALQVKGGGHGFQALIRWLGAMDPDGWSDKPRKTESEQDRAQGLSDDALDEIIAAADTEAA